MATSVRQFSQTSVKNADNIPEGYKKLKITQAKFQVCLSYQQMFQSRYNKILFIFQAHDGLPIFLKGGAMDKGLYSLTIVLCFVGMGSIGKMIYDLAVPAKPE